MRAARRDVTRRRSPAVRATESCTFQASLACESVVFTD